MSAIEQEKKIDERLTPEQDEFCKLYATDFECFGNGTRAYIIAYGLNPANPADYANASNGSSKSLDKPHIIKRINELLDNAGLNDCFNDKQLLFLISQHEDKATKLQAIKEYNRMKGRIIDRMQMDVKDRKVSVEIVKNYTTGDGKPQE